MSIQAIRLNMSSNTSSTIINRFAALAVDDEAPASAAPTRTSPPIQQSQQGPRRAYVPPNMRNSQAPVTQSRLRAAPNVNSTSDFPSLGNRHTPTVTTAAVTPTPLVTPSSGWASRARDWATHDETSAAVELERRRQQEYERQQRENMITLTRPAYRTGRLPTLAPGTSEFVTSSRHYSPSYANEEGEDDAELDAAEAYVGGYDHSKYAFDYQEGADQYAPQDGNNNEYNDGRYTPPYPPTY